MDWGWFGRFRPGPKQVQIERSNPAWDVIVQEIDLSGGRRGNPPLDQDFATYLKAAKLFPLVMACVDKIGAAATDVPWVYTDRKDAPLKNQEASKLKQLFDAPNGLDSGLTLKRKCFQQYAMLGEAFLVLDPTALRPKEVWLWESAKVYHVINRDDTGPPILQWEYRSGLSQSRFVDSSLVIFPHRPNPADPIRGLSPIAELEETLKVILGFYNYQSATLTNGPRIGGILVLKGRPRTPDEREAIGQRIDEKFSGTGANRTMVLQGEDADWKSNALTAKEMEYTQVYDILRREIFNVFQVPPGLFDSKDVNRSNMREQRALLYTDAVRPMVNVILDEINRHPMAIAAGEKIKADWEQVEALQPNQLEEAQTLTAYTKGRVLTRNEARSRLGLDPTEGGDEMDAVPEPAAAFAGATNGNGEAT